MKNFYHRIPKLNPAKTALITAMFFAVGTINSKAQGILYGPESPPPKGASITFTGTANDGQIGFAGGKVFTFTNVQLANTTTTYWSVRDSSVLLSMDGGTYETGEVLELDPAQTNLETGVITWTGNTKMPVSNAAGTGIAYYQNLLSKFVVHVYYADDSPVSLVDTTVTGLPEETGGAVKIENSGMTFKAKFEMFVSQDGGTTWVPHLVYYNNSQTPAGAESAYSSFNFGFYWENDPPEIDHNTGGMVDEGDTLVFSTAMLSAMDVESADDMIRFIIDPGNEGLLPAHGSLFYDDMLLESEDTVSLSEIASGLLEYRHDGGESISDSIPLMLIDGDLAHAMNDGDSVFYFHIDITPVDDPPMVEVNTGGSVDEGAVLTLDETMLLTTDPESGPGEITYTLDPESLVDGPVNGLLKLNGVPLEDGDTFTQSDVNNGLVTYTHDGTKTEEDEFVFQVEDEFGHFAETEGDPNYSFMISITLINELPVLNTPIEDTEATTGIPFSLVLDGNTFSDPDEGDVLTYESHLSNGALLPAWLSFDSENLEFSGTPAASDLGTIGIVVIAKDLEMATASDTFSLEVKSPVGISSISSDFALKVYPNPFTDKLTIENTSEVQKVMPVTIVNILGEKITQIYIYPGEKRIVEFGDNPSGVYFLKVGDGQLQKVKRIMKQ